MLADFYSVCASIPTQPKPAAAAEKSRPFSFSFRFVVCTRSHSRHHTLSHILFCCRKFAQYACWPSLQPSFETAPIQTQPAQCALRSCKCIAQKIACQCIYNSWRFVVVVVILLRSCRFVLDRFFSPRRVGCCAPAHDFVHLEEARPWWFNLIFRVVQPSFRLVSVCAAVHTLENNGMEPELSVTL